MSAYSFDPFKTPDEDRIAEVKSLLAKFEEQCDGATDSPSMRVQLERVAEEFEYDETVVDAAEKVIIQKFLWGAR